MSALDKPCRCHSGRKAKRCCGPWLAGRPAPAPLLLMRSRYCAYRAGLVDYIIGTTDPDGEAYRPDIDVWRRELVHHCDQTRYTRLQILDAPDAAGDTGYVTFRVAFTQGDEGDGFTEQSEFRRVNGIWLYARGQVRASVSASD